MHAGTRRRDSGEEAVHDRTLHRLVLAARADCRENLKNSNKYLLAKIGFDTEDNEPLKVSGGD